jgi:hypothetical protein
MLRNAFLAPKKKAATTCPDPKDEPYNRELS